MTSAYGCKVSLDRSRPTGGLAVRNLVRLILGNLVVLGFLIFSMNVASIAIIKAYNWTKPLQYAESHLLPNYNGAEWARKHFSEYYDLKEADYKAFYGWRRPAFVGQTINIDERGMRLLIRRANILTNDD